MAEVSTSTPLLRTEYRYTLVLLLRPLLCTIPRFRRASFLIADAFGTSFDCDPAKNLCLENLSGVTHIRMFYQTLVSSLRLVFFFILTSAMNALLSQTITVIGGGSVGSTLALAILKSGKVGNVLIAARDPAKTKAKLDEEGKSDLEVQDMKAAIGAGDVLILAVPSVHSDEAIKKMVESLGDVSNKILIDLMNPLSDFQDGLQIRWEQGTSSGEYIQSLLPNTKVYKAFNTLGVEHMSDGTGKDMLFAGPDKDIANVIATVGYKPIYVGPIRYARNLEAMAELWIHCAIPPLPANYLGRDWTFKLAGNYNEE
jgi:8-hydroxy-5-deazaflavin:NADPH oxidoreductase